MRTLALIAFYVLLLYVALGVLAWRLYQRSLRDRCRERHPAGRKRLPWTRRRRLPEQVIAGLTDTEWPGLAARLCDDGRGVHFDRLAAEVVPDTAKDFDRGNQE